MINILVVQEGTFLGILDVLRCFFRCFRYQQILIRQGYCSLYNFLRVLRWGVYYSGFSVILYVLSCGVGGWWRFLSFEVFVEKERLGIIRRGFVGRVQLCDMRGLDFINDFCFFFGSGVLGLLFLSVLASSLRFSGQDLGTEGGCRVGIFSFKFFGRIRIFSELEIDSFRRVYESF